MDDSRGRNEEGRDGLQTHSDPLSALCLALATVLVPPSVVAQPDAPEAGETGESGRPLVYLTREDRREAGIRHEIFPWLTVAGLFESEWTRERPVPVEDGPGAWDRELANTLQLAAEIKPSDWSKFELIYEYEDDDDHNRHVLDEALLALEFGDFEWEVGRLYAPFGEYFSQFVEGPVLEFGETRASGMNLSYSPAEVLDLKIYAFEGRDPADPGDGIQWGFAAEFSPTRSGTLGFSYISSITDAEDPVVDVEDLEGGRESNGVSGYAVFGIGPFEVNAEFVAALEHLQVQEPDRDHPLAWNTELAWFPGDRYQLSLRFEGTREVADEPRRRFGIGGAWWVAEGMVLRLEYLYGKHEPGLAEDDLERELDHVDLLAAQLSVEF